MLDLVLYPYLNFANSLEGGSRLSKEWMIYDYHELPFRHCPLQVAFEIAGIQALPAPVSYLKLANPRR